MGLHPFASHLLAPLLYAPPSLLAPTPFPSARCLVMLVWWSPGMLWQWSWEGPHIRAPLRCPCCAWETPFRPALSASTREHYVVLILLSSCLMAAEGKQRTQKWLWDWERPWQNITEGKPYIYIFKHLFQVCKHYAYTDFEITTTLLKNHD